MTVDSISERFELSESYVRKLLRDLHVPVEYGEVVADDKDLREIFHHISKRTLKEAALCQCVTTGMKKYFCLLKSVKGKECNETHYLIFRNSQLIKEIPTVLLEIKHSVKVDNGVHLVFFEEDDIVDFVVLEQEEDKT